MVKKMIVKHIIPFEYELPVEIFLNTFQHSAHFEENDMTFTDDLKINSSLLERCKEKHFITKFKVLKFNKNTIMNEILSNHKHHMSFKEKIGNKTDDFTIKNIDVYIFGSQTGFIIIDFEIFSNSVEEIVNTSYYLKMIKSKYVRDVEVHKKIGKNDIKTYDLDLVSVYEEIHDLMGIRNNIYLSSELLVYSAVLFDNADDKNNDSLLSILAHGYKKSYKLSGNLSNTIKKFDNIHWCSSIEGVACFSYLSDDDTTNDFLVNNFFTKAGALNSVYLFLYLLVLNQRMVMQNLNVRINKISTQNMNNEIDKIHQGINDIRVHISNYEVNFVYRDISRNSTYNEYYNMLYQTQNLDDLLFDYKNRLNGLEQLYKIVTSNLEKRKRKSDNEKNRKISNIAKFGILIAFIAFLPNFREVVLSISSDLDCDIESYPVMLILFIIGLVVLIIRGLIIWYINKSKENFYE